MNILEDLVLVIIVMLMASVIGIFGWTLSERSHCIKSGGIYQYDFGRCEHENYKK